eukprot:GHVP01041667.1.p1 GENE.GHVP01041667.1~~GHVP01041667.1.p1  ORF type:complete len:229 (+),score=16.16 GHVP01041667.1:1709-2395(+)
MIDYDFIEMNGMYLEGKVIKVDGKYKLSLNVPGVDRHVWVLLDQTSEIFSPRDTPTVVEGKESKCRIIPYIYRSVTPCMRLDIEGVQFWTPLFTNLFVRTIYKDKPVLLIHGSFEDARVNSNKIEKEIYIDKSSLKWRSCVYKFKHFKSHVTEKRKTPRSRSYGSLHEEDVDSIDTVYCSTKSGFSKSKSNGNQDHSDIYTETELRIRDLVPTNNIGMRRRYAIDRTE